MKRIKDVLRGTAKNFRADSTKGFMKRKHYVFLLLAIVAAPIIVNLILYCNNPISTWLPTIGLPNEWIGFWGNVVGNILGGIIVLIVLHYTLKDNAILRNAQIKTIRYTQQQNWLDNLRKQIIANYNMIDMQSLSIALNKLQQGEYEEAQKSLLYLNRNIEFQANQSSLYLLHDDLAQEEQNYIDCVKQIIIKYGCLINDSIFLSTIFSNTNHGISDTFESSNENIISFAKEFYNTFIVSSRLLDDETKDFYSRNSVLTKVMKLDPTDINFQSHLNEITKELLISFCLFQANKYELIKCSENVLRYEKRRIDKILE